MTYYLRVVEDIGDYRESIARPSQNLISSKLYLNVLGLPRSVRNVISLKYTALIRDEASSRDLYRTRI